MCRLNDSAISSWNLSLIHILVDADHIEDDEQDEESQQTSTEDEEVLSLQKMCIRDRVQKAARGHEAALGDVALPDDLLRGVGHGTVGIDVYKRQRYVSATAILLRTAQCGVTP